MNKKVAVRYFSKSGNTKKIAAEIANFTGWEALAIDKPINEPIDVLFLGASVYWGGIDNRVKEFIRTLDASKIGKVAVFSTSALTERAYPDIKKLLQEKSIITVSDDFYCRGQFGLLHRGKPDESDLKEVRKYAMKVT